LDHGNGALLISSSDILDIFPEVGDITYGETDGHGRKEYGGETGAWIRETLVDTWEACILVLFFRDGVRRRSVSL